MTQHNDALNGRHYNESEIDRLFNGTVYGSGDEKIGSVGQVYLNDASGQPEWVTVKTGLFGSNETFVPLKYAQVEGDNIRVPYTKEFVKDAPNIDPDKHIDENEQAALYRYYEEHHQANGERFADNTRNETVAGGVADRGYADRDLRKDAVADRNVEGEHMVAHEERLNVDKRQEEAGRVKLRKRVVTENQQVTVPVEREELVVDRQPVNEVTDHKIGTDKVQDETIVLHEERPVVTKETVATEQVNVGKKTVTENQVVQDQVRKEHIEVEGENVRDRGVADRDLKDPKRNI